MLDNYFLSTLIALPLLGCVHLALLPGHKTETIKVTGLTWSFLVFIFSLFLWVNFEDGTAHFQFFESYPWLVGTNTTISLGVDGISLWFILLTTLLVPLCLIGSWAGISHRVKEYLIAFLGMEALLLGVFTILDVFAFYILFEGVLIPMFLIIGIWGSRERKIRAAYLFFMYTLVGSLLMLFAILYLGYVAGSTDLQVLLETPLDPTVQVLLFLAFFASFAAKFPLIPFHLWLPEAHVEAPTGGSVILAGVLLKLGSYGLLRFAMPLFPYASHYLTPLMFTLGALGVLYASLTAVRQTDMKRVIAYASIGHMGVILIGMFTFNSAGVEGSIFQMLSHGLVASALFLCVGVLYDRHHTRAISYYGGVAHVAPLYAIIFLFFTMANIAFPGTSSFVGEFLILAGAFVINPSIAAVGALGMVLSAAYSLFLFNRVCYGNLKVNYLHAFSDVNRIEFALFVPLLFFTALLGLYLESILVAMHTSVSNWLELVQV
jgi:proton-translocating NADH-quinone oxidoreductase chain M